MQCVFGTFLGLRTTGKHGALVRDWPLGHPGDFPRGLGAGAGVPSWAKMAGMTRRACRAVAGRGPLSQRRSRKLPADTDRLGGVRHIRHRDHAAIRTALGLGPLDPTALNAQPDGDVPWVNQGVEPERTHLLLVDPSVLQRLRHAGLASGKEGRQGKFCQTACLTLAQESIAQD